VEDRTVQDTAWGPLVACLNVPVDRWAEKRGRRNLESYAQGMELSLGRRADYAIRATLDLARHPGERRKSRQIGETMSVPASYLPQILAELVRAGLVTSVAGPQGGYELARPVAEISLLDVVRATEGDVASTQCVLRGGPCRWEGVCAVHVPWSRAQQALIDQLAATSFREVAAIDAELEAGTFAVPDDLRERDVAIDGDEVAGAAGA
jgi:Rrf2 family transcriptional regulator, iron-sulfur cluster assembly transcription factor